LVKEGSGKLVIGDLHYAGDLTVSEGTLIADSLACNTLTVAGELLDNQQGGKP